MEKTTIPRKISNFAKKLNISMKAKIGIILISIIIALPSAAQLAVMGIDITTLTEFKAAMKTKTKKKPKRFNNTDVRYKKVEFAGYKPCGVIIEYNPQTDSILSVTIRFPQYFYPPESPSIVMNEMIYSDMGKQLEAKYGQTTEDKNYSRPNGLGEDPYHTMNKIWKLDDGEIRLCYLNFGRVTPTFGDMPTGEDFPIIRSFVEIIYSTNAKEYNEVVIASPDL